MLILSGQVFINDNFYVTGTADVEAMSSEQNVTRLETAFYVAEVHLGITRLIDPEDVDVESPGDKLNPEGDRLGPKMNAIQLTELDKVEGSPLSVFSTKDV